MLDLEQVRSAGGGVVDAGWDPTSVVLAALVAALLLCLRRAVLRCKNAEAENREARDRFEATLAESTRVKSEVNRELERELGAGRRELAKLRRAEIRYRELFQTGPDIYLDVSDDHEVVSVNAFGLEALGCDEGSVIGRSFFSLVHRRDLIRLHESLRRVTDQPGSVEDLDCRLVSGLGSDLWVNMRIRACVDDDHPGLRVVCRDISKQRLASEQQEQSQARATEAEKLESLGVLAGGIAHDFNNLLVAVLGNAGLVAFELEALELDEGSKVRRFVREIERAATRAAVLADQLLAYSGNGGGQKLALELNRLVDEAVRLFTAVLPGDSIVLELAEDLPVFEGDPNQIGQALINLIANATDTLRGGGALKLGTRLETLDAEVLAETRFGVDLDPGDYVTVDIVALGGGDAEALERRIFDPFVSTDDVGRDLGMACVLGVVRRHKGTIEVAEQPDGTVLVRLRFPVAPDAIGAGVAPAGSYAGLPPLSASAGTILVVDNEEAIRTLAKSALELSGFEVLTAGNGEQAIELFRKHGHRIDVTLLDVTMSDMSGEETLERLHEIGPKPSVIVSSGFIEADVMRRFGGSDCAFLKKPYRPFTLVAKVLEMVEDASQAPREGS